MYLKFVLLFCVADLAQFVIGDYYTGSKEVGKLGRNYDPKKDRRYPFELGMGHYFQGDILMAPPNKTRVSVTERYANKFWPNGRVPYEIVGSFNEQQVNTIHQAVQMYRDNTCIRYVKKRPTDTAWVKFYNKDEGCYAYVGKQNNNDHNMVNLQTPLCTDHVGAVVHEMMHVLGFYHEFTRPDRDDWITINKSALVAELQDEETYQSNYGKLDANEVDTYDIPYNYGSVMHYSKYAGAKDNNYPAMNNIQPWDGDFGNLNGFADSDINSINIRYKCPSRKAKKSKTLTKKINKSKDSKSD